MPRAIFEFKCDSCGETHERYAPSDLQESFCLCGKMAKKIISAPAYFKNGKFRSDIDSDSWAIKREQKARRVAKSNAE